MFKSIPISLNKKSIVVFSSKKSTQLMRFGYRVYPLIRWFEFDCYSFSFLLIPIRKTECIMFIVFD
jgi:hypothetical protein